jgi:RimJ/RimL family protein N-acetyltransferase
MGETSYKGKGVAKEASRLILSYGFEELCLNRIYLFTEVDNIAAQKLFERVGFKREGILKQDVYSHGAFADRIAYGFLKEEWKRGDQ